MSAVRVLFLIDNLRPGGAQKALLAMARALKAEGSHPAVWCLGGTSEIEKDFDAAGVPVLGRPASLWGTMIEPVSLFRYLRRERVELVQTFLFHSDVTGRVIGRMARIFAHGRRPIVASSVRASNIRNRAWQFLLLRLTAPLADAFTSVSTLSLEFAAAHEGVVRARATVIPNGIAAEPIAPETAAQARRELELPPEAFVVATLSRLHEQKGHADLLQAARCVADKMDNVVFLFAGYGPLRETLEARTRELGLTRHVRFLGYRRDVDRILAACDVFALPSLWEGMSNAILEAMAAGKPVVATAVDGNVEQVAGGETGLLVPARNPEALASALLRLAGNREEARTMGRRGQERVRSEFSLERMTRSYRELYQGLLAERAESRPAIPASAGNKES